MQDDPSDDPKTTDQAPVSKAGAVNITPYNVLSFDKASNGWKLVGDNLHARSAEAAIRVYAEKAGSAIGEGLTLVAVPARSWRPVKVTAKVQTTLELSEL